MIWAGILGALVAPMAGGTWDYTGGFCGGVGGQFVTFGAGFKQCELEITGAGSFARGAAWLSASESFSPTSSMWSAKQIRIDGGGGADGGDGLVFALKGLPHTSSDSTTIIGFNGGNLGYQGIVGDKSVAVEFDTYQNEQDQSGNHLGILRDFTTQSHEIQVDAPFDINGPDTGVFWAWIEYSGVQKVLRVYLSQTATQPLSAPLIEFNIDLQTALDPSAVFIGFTAGTGGSANRHRIITWQGYVCEDADGDIVCDADDVCPGEDDRIDTDGDTVPDCDDNCPDDPNTDQMDTDNDGTGDACQACSPQPETCNGLDDDCDGQTDEGVLPVWYEDGDGDGFGRADVTQSACAKPDGYVSVSGDCDDGASAVFPGASEVCNGVDDDCDTLTADGAAETWLGIPCDSPLDTDLCQGGVFICSNGTQFCDDTPEDAVEVCNELDDDCDGQTDEGTTTTFWFDGDGDGFGVTANPIQACSKPADYADVDGDCNDGAAAVYPGAPELCNGIDDDCAATPDGSDETWFNEPCDGGDSDLCAEGTFQCAGTTTPQCDDTTGDDVETCNGVDDDCDGSIDEGLLSTWYRDQDGDGFGTASDTQLACTKPQGYVSVAGDCDDQAITVFPGAAEVCNGVDDDCNTSTADGSAEPWLNTNCDGPDADLCEGGTRVCSGGEEVCTDSAEDAVEVCNDIDDDCDGQTDEGTLTTFWLDDDNDGFGDTTQPTEACTEPVGYAPVSGDCNDGVKAINPDASDICNGLDDDCNTNTPDGAAETWFGQACDGPDADLCTEGQLVCDGISSQTCDDLTDDSVEVCDTIDNDCDGETDEGNLLGTYYEDNDGDGFGNTDVSVQNCGAPAGFVETPGDCNDGDKQVFPGQTERCNGVDDDCDDGTVDGQGENWFGTPCDGPDSDLCTEGANQCVSGTQSCSDTSDDSIEVCNGGDDDCDGEVDEGTLTTFYRDADNDQFGDPDVALLACSAPAGYVTNNEDCKDDVFAINPDADELCNGIDDDCDDQTADGADVPTIGDVCDGADADNCNEGVFVCTSGLLLCSDDSADNVEICNELDDDCDGETDEGLLTTFYEDTDGDGFGILGVTQDACTVPGGFATQPGDCDDAIGTTYPGAPEVCNGVDDDCSTTTPDGSSETWFDKPCDGADADVCEEGTFECVGGAQACSDDSADNDEICNALDDDCDGQTDEGTLVTFYQDSDGDGFGNPAASTQACTQPDGFVVDGSDCNDGAKTVYPNALDLCNGVNDDCNADTPDGTDEPTAGQPCDGIDADLCEEGVVTCVGGILLCGDSSGDSAETCDGQDNDCDGETDEGLLLTFYKDGDDDGFGDADSPTQACALPNGYVENTSDCNDLDKNVYPGAPDICNGIDDDCSPATVDGVSEPWYNTACDGADTDLCEEGQLRCDGSGSYCTDTTDNSDELCDGLDNDCDGEIDEGEVLTTFYADTDNDTYGDPDNTTQACAPPPDYVTNKADCNDSVITINPAASEKCNGVDDDCDPLTVDGADDTCDDDNVCSVDSCNVAAGACDNAWIEGCCVVDEDCPDPGPCSQAQCISGQCVAQPECLAIEVCVFDQCTSKCDPVKQPTKCSDSGDTLFNCLTDAVTGDSGWVASACEGSDLCAFDETATKFKCCTPNCDGKECGMPSECMVPCGTCEDGWACAGPNEALEVPGTDPDAFSCVPGCASVADAVPDDEQDWSVSPPECGEPLAGTENLSQCGLCEGFSACYEGKCRTACEEAQVTAVGRCSGFLAQWCEDSSPRELDCAAEGSYCCAADDPLNPTDHAACCSCATECADKGWECGVNSCGEPCSDLEGDGCGPGFDCQGRQCVCVTPGLCEEEADAGPESGAEVVSVEGDAGAGAETGTGTVPGSAADSGCEDCSGGGRSGPWPALGLVAMFWFLRRRAQHA